MIPDTSSTDRALPPRRRLSASTVGVAAALLAAIGLGLWLLLDSSPSVPLAQLRLATVSRGSFVSDINTQGRVVAHGSPGVYAPASGVVNLQVQAGDVVSAGQLLASLDSPELRNELDAAEAELAGLFTALAQQRIEMKARRLQLQQAVDLARVSVSAAERELKRSRDAHAQGLLPDMDVDRRGDELSAAQVQYAHALAEAELQAESLDVQLRSRQQDVERQQLAVANAQRRVDELSLRSPVAGVVGNVMVEPRAAVTPNTAIATVVDLSALEVEIQIPESYASSLALGMPADIRVGSEHYAGVLTAISPEVQNAQVSGRVRFADRAPDSLRQNQRVAVRILIDAREDVLQVSRGRFLDTSGGRFAWVVHGDRALRTPIRVGAIAVDRVELLDGVSEGEQLVISGDDRFADAEVVRLRR